MTQIDLPFSVNCMSKSVQGMLYICEDYPVLSSAIDGWWLTIELPRFLNKSFLLDFCVEYMNI